VALTEGHNTIIARAVTSQQEGTATIAVSLDLTRRTSRWNPLRRVGGDE